MQRVAIPRMHTHQVATGPIYRKQQNLHGRKPSWFSQIFDEPQKFSILIL